MRHRFQMVLQLPVDRADAESLVPQLEGTLREEPTAGDGEHCFEDSAVLGSVLEIFIATDDPAETFQRTRSLWEQEQLLDDLTVVYRRYMEPGRPDSSATLIVLWPRAQVWG